MFDHRTCARFNAVCLAVQVATGVVALMHAGLVSIKLVLDLPGCSQHHHSYPFLRVLLCVVPTVAATYGDELVYWQGAIVNRSHLRIHPATPPSGP